MKNIKINEISENDDIPLGRYNHELNTNTKSQPSKHITSYVKPILQHKQHRRGRPHRQLMLTTQE